VAYIAVRIAGGAACAQHSGGRHSGGTGTDFSG
jgi:hypothetical protein